MSLLVAHGFLEYIITYELNLFASFPAGISMAYDLSGSRLENLGIISTELGRRIAVSMLDSCALCLVVTKNEGKTKHSKSQRSSHLREKR